MPYRLTPRARLGLLRILDYVGERFGNATALDVLDRRERAFELLAENPGMGHRRDDITSDHRILFWSEGPSLIAYRSSAEGLDILMVERGERDWRRLFRESADS